MCPSNATILIANCGWNWVFLFFVSLSGCLCYVNRSIYIHITRPNSSDYVHFGCVFLSKQAFHYFFYSSSSLRLFSSNLPFQWMSKFISFLFLIRRSIFSFCSNNFRSSVMLAFGHWKKFSINIYISTRVPSAKFRR